jgi:alcohol dehydrogenase class IV
MTLITYLTRVHFADGILEDALWSEIKALGKKRPLVLIDSDTHKHSISDRLFSGLPTCTKPEVFSDLPDIPTEDQVLKLAQIYLENECDVIIAFGDERSIDLAKIIRIAVKHPHIKLEQFSYLQGGSKLIGDDLPEVIAVPNISGVAASVSAQSSLVLNCGELIFIMCKKLVPNITVCDPTTTLDAEEKITAGAGADAIANCIEAYVSKGYNPPAEGIAYDGLRRAVCNLDQVLKHKDDLNSRREMMAASLNGALALQKGLGASKAISNALSSVSSKWINRGILNRVALPSVIRYNEKKVSSKYEILQEAFGDRKCQNFPTTVSSYFEKLPLPTSLSALGFDDAGLVAAASIASSELSSMTNPRTLNSGDCYSIMKSVY